MADYIDRQAAIETIHSAIYPYFCGAEDGDILSEDEKLVLSVNKTICTAIIALPSADVVEVVRCKDCKHRYYTLGISAEWYQCELWHDAIEDNDFCSRAERRTE